MSSSVPALARVLRQCLVVQSALRSSPHFRPMCARCPSLPEHALTCTPRYLPTGSSLKGGTSGPRPAFVWVEMATSRHSVDRQVAVATEQDRHRRSGARRRDHLSRSPETGARASKAKTVGSTEPRTRAPHAGGELGDDGGTGATDEPEAFGGRRDCGGRERGGKRRRGLRSAWRRDPSERRPGKPARRTEGGEHRHELNILGSGRNRPLLSRDHAHVR